MTLFSRLTHPARTPAPELETSEMIDAFIDSQVLIPGKWQPVPQEKLNSNTLKSQLLQKIQQNLETYKESI